MKASITKRRGIDEDLYDSFVPDSKTVESRQLSYSFLGVCLADLPLLGCAKG